jgi:hypothetical protein
VTVTIVGTVTGASELRDKLGQLPGKVVRKIMVAWTIDQARMVSKIARASAPRRPGAARGNTPRSAQLWRSIRASAINKGLKKFGPETIARSITYGAADRWNKSKTGPRARHFHLSVNGTVDRVQKTTGRRTGRMWGVTSNPHYWRNAVDQVTKRALSDVNTRLKFVYDRELQKHIRSIIKANPTGRYP